MLVSFLDYISFIDCAFESQQMSYEASLSLETMYYQYHVREAAEVLAVTSFWYSLWSSASPRGQWKTGKSGENWLQDHLWCPNGPHD